MQKELPPLLYWEHDISEHPNMVEEHNRVWPCPNSFQANRGHYLLKATGGLLTVWLGTGELRDTTSAISDIIDIMAGIAQTFPDIPFCLLNSTFLEPDVLGRFLCTQRVAEGSGAMELADLEAQAAVAVLFLGQLAGISKFQGGMEQDVLRRYVFPLELPFQGDGLCDFIQSARSGGLEGEEVPTSARPLLKETFVKVERWKVAA